MGHAKEPGPNIPNILAGQQAAVQLEEGFLGDFLRLGKTASDQN